MYNGSNPSAKRSQNWIAEGFVSLMLQKKLNEITVKEIMKATDLSRQTFYQLFDSVEDVLEYHIDTLFQEYIKRCKVEEVDNLCDAAQLLLLSDWLVC
jgi:AcrR family transcriptional regulator